MPRLTLGTAKTKLADFAPESKLTDRINTACSMLMLDGRWIGNRQRLTLRFRNGVAALPRNVSALLACKENNNPLPIANDWYEFLPGKHYPDHDMLTIAEDLGENFATLQPLPSGGALTADGEIVVYGTNADLFPVEQNIVVSTGVPFDNPFTTITRISKSAGSPVSLIHSVAGLVAYLEGPETEASFHLIRITRLSDKPTADIYGLCQLRHIDAVADTDLLSVSNLNALRFALRSLQAEAESDLERAQAHWANAVSILNKETKMSRSPDEFGIPRVQFIGQGELPRAIV